MQKEEIISVLSSKDDILIKKTFKEAYKVKIKNTGQKVYLRGIIEFSNICEKNCFYCGIRKSNKNIKRFFMTQKEIIETAFFADREGYGSIVIQSGERSDKEFIFFIENILKKIKKTTSGRLGITLSLGEQSYDTYKRWFDAGAHRYLLRIETSCKKLYKTLHPSSHNYDVRFKCLEYLKKINYQVGTGVMIGLPCQTYEELADDIMFFKKNDIDMIGMGPYIIHKNTPLAEKGGFNPSKNFMLGLKMIALSRLYLKDINIAATTALQSLDLQGYKKGVLAGANVIMPNITPLKYCRNYNLYEGKTNLNINVIQKQIHSAGENIIYGQWGDSPHFFKRQKLK
jgi:biotin synthase